MLLLLSKVVVGVGVEGEKAEMKMGMGSASSGRDLAEAMGVFLRLLVGFLSAGNDVWSLRVGANGRGVIFGEGSWLGERGGSGVESVCGRMCV